MRSSLLSTVIPILALSFWGGCSKKEEKPVQTATAKPASSGYENVSEIPEETQKQLVAFGRQLERDLQAGRTQAVQTVFSPIGIVDGICDGIRTSDQQLEEFKTGLRSGILTTIKFLAATWVRQQPKFKGVVLCKGAPSVRFRFISDGGITLLDLVVRNTPQGKPVIVDFYNQGLGFGMVEQGKQTATPILAVLDKSFLERLLGKPNMTTDDMQRFSDLSRSFRDGDYRRVIASYQYLPEVLRTNLSATALYIAAVQRYDKKAYKQALEEAAERFKTANFQFMLVDLYFMDKKYDKAIECLDAFMVAVDKDAALLALKSLLLYAKKDIPAATATLKEALQLEPDCVYVHSKGLDVLLAAKDFAAARDSMVFLEQNGGYNFKGKLTDPLWNEFKKAPESKPWR